MRIIIKSAYICYMKARLNLTIDEQLLLSVKKMAEKNEISVSELVEEFFKKLTKPAKQKNIIDIIERLEKPVISADANLKELYYKEQSTKYGF